MWVEENKPKTHALHDFVDSSLSSEENRCSKDALYKFASDPLVETFNAFFPKYGDKTIH
jgi:hypothetical protein